jgi:two-component sensor histidine kinase
VVEHGGRRQIIGVNVDITQRKKQEDNLHFIMDELSHRTKNLLSIVQAIASQTARYSGNFSNFAFWDAFELWRNRTIYSSVGTGVARRFWT